MPHKQQKQTSEVYQTKKIKNKMLLHDKGSQQSEKATYGMGENTCKSYIW